MMYSGPPGDSVLPPPIKNLWDGISQTHLNSQISSYRSIITVGKVAEITVLTEKNKFIKEIML